MKCGICGKNIDFNKNHSEHDGSYICRKCTLKRRKNKRAYELRKRQRKILNCE